ncbi:MAG TPA: carbohydrate kinase family protein [Bacteroidales bacterium]|nr:carbohydrate kinase family protein [Bacteroidales bacterium]
MSRKIIVSGVGCCLVDLLYNNIDFTSDTIRPWFSKNRGDGGLTPGKLVFQEEFEQFCGRPFTEVLEKITSGRVYDKINIGGPSVVSLINLAQLTGTERCDVRFYGRGGKDEMGEYLLSALKRTPVILKDYKLIDNRTPSTVVLSDPTYDKGHGERMFINSIGAAWDYRPDDLDDDFFDSDIVVFGGTALVPQIHDHLTTLLSKAKSNDCITVVNTVFDFRNEKSDPSKRWPLGETDESYKNIDLLITDQEEAIRLSGEHDPMLALKFFTENKVSSVIITNGARNIITTSDGRFFGFSDIMEMPVSQRITKEIRNYQGGDTTGCGDNFVGGVIASVVDQRHKGIPYPDLREACSWGIVSGGFTCFYIGGTWFEEKPGEKLERIKPYYESYREQIAH